MHALARNPPRMHARILPPIHLRTTPPAPDNHGRLLLAPRFLASVPRTAAAAAAAVAAAALLEAPTP